MMWEISGKTYISDAENYPRKSAKSHDQTLPMKRYVYSSFISKVPTALWGVFSNHWTEVTFL